MDNSLDLKLKEFKKSLDSLEAALAKKRDEFIRDSVIKRFEYCFELSWKTAKIFLSEKFGVDVYSPKSVFRELFKNQLIADEETEKLLEATDDRNEVIHTYNEKFSNEIYGRIRKDYFSLLKKVYSLIECG